MYIYIYPASIYVYIYMYKCIKARVYIYIFVYIYIYKHILVHFYHMFCYIVGTCLVFVATGKKPKKVPGARYCWYLWRPTAGCNTQTLLEVSTSNVILCIHIHTHIYIYIYNTLSYWSIIWPLTGCISTYIWCTLAYSYVCMLLSSKHCLWFQKEKLAMVISYKRL